MYEENIAISLQPAGNGSNGHSEFAVSKEMSVDEAIDAIGAGKFQWKILCVTGLFWAADAIEIMRLTFLLPIWKDEWELDDGIDGTIGAVVFAGMLFGAMFWSNFSDRYGRKKAVLLSNFFQVIFGTASAFMVEIYGMLILRFLTGFCLGGSSCGYTLYAEFAPKNIRGKMLVLNQSFWAAGCFINALIAWITLELFDWRWYMIISNIPMVVTLFLGWTLPESARWLAINGKLDRAESILNKAAKDNNGTREIIQGTK